MQKEAARPSVWMDPRKEPVNLRRQPKKNPWKTGGHGGPFGRPEKNRPRGSPTPGRAIGVLVQGEVQKNPRGFAFLLHRPADIFIPGEFAAKLITGDAVKAWVHPKTKEVLRLEITKRALKQFIGTYGAGFGNRVVTLEDRGMRETVYVRERPNLEGLRTGDKVLAEITKYEPQLEGRILRAFGAKLAPKLDTFSVVVRSQWPQEFSAAAIEEAEKLSEAIQREAEAAGYPGRKDLRSKPFVTIDGADARDFDDAILVEKTGSGFALYVAIADVAEFVRPGTKLDAEAYARATSVYFPEWVIPMLPEALSNGACSLRPDEDKLTLTCEMHFAPDGKKRQAKIYESVIRSKRRCIYEDVQKEYESGAPGWKDAYELFRRIREKRYRRGALDLDLPEAKVVLDSDANTIDIRKLERVDSHKLIEEFMIAANESVTEIMELEDWPFVYRVHEPPKPEALERFERFAMALGLKPRFGEGDDPRVIAAFIDSIRERPYSNTLHYLLLRSLKQARYEPVNLYHFGLASKAYTHFTSPIRRYPDTMVHRILKKYVRRQKIEGPEAAVFDEYLAEACDHCSKQERKAEQLDRAVVKIKKARFMEKHLGESFDANVTNVSEAGVFVELEKWFVEGLVPVDELGSDYFEYVEERLMLKGKRSGRKFRIGDPIRVTVMRVDIDNGFVDFTLDDEQAPHGMRRHGGD
ncbi:MAG: ribonuclease R [Deltaproteobacteria bacterium]|nr:ribonuclease R [Deltaproteobacteria bacterium]